MMIREEKLTSILCLSTAGLHSRDSRRMRDLCQGMREEIVFHEVDRSINRGKAWRTIARLLAQRHWDLVYLEGTGIVGGLALICAAWLKGQRFIVSSGDPIGGFFRTTRGPLLGKVFEAYELCLYTSCTAFVGWTPYLTGAALKMGARRAATIEGGVDLKSFRPPSSKERESIRARLGLLPNHLVCGVAGTLTWVGRQSYCYGLELVEVLKLARRTDLSILIVGDGDGRARLEAAVPEVLRPRVVFTGYLPEAEVVEAMGAMDIGFVTQTLGALGSFRLSTKLPEYLACGVPVAMSPIPGYYDYAANAGWALPDRHPSSREFHRRCAAWVDSLSNEEITAKAACARNIAELRFDSGQLAVKFQCFVQSLLSGDSC